MSSAQTISVSPVHDKAYMLITLYARLLTDESTSDVTFIVGKDRDVVKGHRAILANRSDVFRAMLFGQMRESQHLSFVEIPDVTVESFRLLMLYCYTEHCPITVDDVYALAYAARKYQLETLHEECLSFIRDRITAAGALEVFEHCVAIGEHELVAESEHFIKDYTADVLSHESFCDAPFDLVKQILSMDDLFLPNEAVAAQACISWHAAECQRRAIDPQSDVARDILVDLLSNVRMQHLSAADLATYVYPCRALPPDQLLALMSAAILREKHGPLHSALRLRPRFDGDIRWLWIHHSGSENTSASCAKFQTLLGSSATVLFHRLSSASSCVPVEDLRRFAAVLVTTDGNYRNAEGFDGTPLAEYVHEGGNVVVCTFATTITGQITGRFATEQLLPIVPGPQEDGALRMMGKIHVPSCHPLLYQIAHIDGGTKSYRAADVKPRHGADLIASWDDGVPLVVSQAHGSGRVTALNFFPVDSTVHSGGFTVSSSGYQLLVNALMYHRSATTTM